MNYRLNGLRQLKKPFIFLQYDRPKLWVTHLDRCLRLSAHVLDLRSCLVHWPPAVDSAHDSFSDADGIGDGRHGPRSLVDRKGYGVMPRPNSYNLANRAR